MLVSKTIDEHFISALAYVDAKDEYNYLDQSTNFFILEPMEGFTCALCFDYLWVCSSNLNAIFAANDFTWMKNGSHTLCNDKETNVQSRDNNNVSLHSKIIENLDEDKHLCNK